MNKKTDTNLATRTRLIEVGGLRAFIAVAKHLNFRLAADELALTQSAVSRQIQAFEQELGLSLFVRHTRRVELSQAGAQLLQTVGPSLQRIDGAVRQVRQRSHRRSVAITTWASFASMWLLPRLEGFQRDYPEIDIRIDASDVSIDLENSELDLALRYAPSYPPQEYGQRLFGEKIMPVMSPVLLKGRAKLKKIDDLEQFTLIEDNDIRGSQLQWLSWRGWLDVQGRQKLQPKRWLLLDYTYHMIQAALAGQGVVLARSPLVVDQLASGQLIEPLSMRRIQSDFTYWLVVNTRAAARPEVQAFCQWMNKEAEKTRRAIGDGPDADTLTGSLDD